MNTPFIRKGSLYALGVIAAGAISMPAFAESTEFRRGYEQGYRDGLEAQHHQDPQRGSTGRIDIDTARYGSRNASCNPRDKLQKAANKARNSDGWRRGFSIVANNELCGDPAPNVVKQLDISFRCDNGPMQRTQTREGSTVILSCDGNQARYRDDQQRRPVGMIDIETARYGTRHASCNPKEKLQRDANTARNSSGWRRGFTVVANNELCGDPSRHNAKQLDISFRCDDGPVQRTQTREGGSVTLRCDGTAAQSHENTPRASMAQIDIETARYGTRHASCNPRDKLQRAINTAQNSDSWRNAVSIAANNQLCGDPDPHDAKQLDVSYRCDDGPVLRAQAREGSNATLNCQ